MECAPPTSGQYSDERDDDAPSAVMARGALCVMREQIEQRLRELARRAGISGAPPAVVAAALGVCLIVVLWAAWRWWPREGAVASGVVTAAGTELSAQPGAAGSDPVSQSLLGAGESSIASGSPAVYVHVIGAVRRPGMYELKSGARVADAVSAAGGLLGNAAQAGVNLARVVSDGEQISVPTAAELARGVVSGVPGSDAPVSGRGSAASPQDSGADRTQALVNINTADAAALDTLPGVGPSTADKIVADREANGPFSSADDLGRVAGIGPKKLEELKPRVCVR